MTAFLLIRHGETDWNRALRFQGHIDVALNPMGRAQADRLGRRFSNPDTSWFRTSDAPVHVVCSDLLRARETATPLAAALGRPIETEPGLREQSFGIFEGLQVAQIQRRYPDEWQRWRAFDPDFALPQAESTRAFSQRVRATLDALAARFAGEHVVVVTHGGVLDMVWRHVHQLSLQGPRVCEIPNAGINRLRNREQAWAVVAWADTAHLQDLPPQPVYPSGPVQK